MYLHLPLSSSPFLFWGNVLVKFTVISVCSSVWSILEHKWHFANSTVGIYRCILRRFRKDFDSIICQRTLGLGTLGVKAQMSHAKSEKHELASKSLQRSHAITHFCTPSSPVPGPSWSSSAWPDFEHCVCVCVCVCVCWCACTHKGYYKGYMNLNYLNHLLN